MSVLEASAQEATSGVVELAESVMERLGRAWNSADGRGFAEPFSADADFVDIRGDLHRGRHAIGEGHQQIFDTIYAGSTVRYQIVRARELNGQVIVAHARCTITAPSGPLAGEHASSITAVLLKREDDHEITAFHNTLIAE